MRRAALPGQTANSVKAPRVAGQGDTNIEGLLETV